MPSVRPDTPLPGTSVQEAPQASKDDAPLLAVDNLALHFRISATLVSRAFGGPLLLKAVDGVDFHVRAGETLAIVGESGCGKSTIVRSVAGLYKPTRGAIHMDGEDITRGRKRSRAVRRRLSMIFQDPTASLNPRWRAEAIIAEPLRTLGAATADTPTPGDLLEQVGLSASDGAKYPHEFSGGQRQRISIARALACRPDLVLCDEPTSALDVSVQAQILNLMSNLQRDLGLSYLFISHDLAVVNHVANRIAVMYLGRFCEVASTNTLFETPRHPYTQMLLAAVPDLSNPGSQRTPVAGEVPSPLNKPSGCAFHPRCPHADDRCRAELPELMPAGEATVACHAVQDGRI